MDTIGILSKTQTIVVKTQQEIVVENRTAKVYNSPQSVTVVPSGSIGPPGVAGPEGPAGVDADTQVEELMYGHINDPTPHPAYDDMPDLTILLENGLI